MQTVEIPAFVYLQYRLRDLMNSTMTFDEIVKHLEKVCKIHKIEKTREELENMVRHYVRVDESNER